jgi:CHAT domain-containing protein
LHYLPFAALADGYHYFGEDHQLFYLPSASVLPFIQKKSKPVSNRVLALAQSQSAGFSFLQYADKEANEVAELYNTKAITSADATKTTFVSRAGDYSILHIAAHAELNTRNPLFSRIFFAPDKESDGVLEVREVYNLNLNKSSLVVLSACETQLGAWSNGDDIVGLNRAFIYAGAPTVVASLWTVDDEATGVFMKAFYSSLRQEMGKAEALRQAQQETRSKYPNPYYWAGFVLTGDPS